MDYLLDSIEVRVFGSLIEKQMTTPDYYPLTLNSLLAACNQKTSRNPVTSYSEMEVIAAIEGLREKGFVVQVNIAGSRAEKFRHQIDEFAEFSSKEIAILCVLMLRGPQTIGELRQRSERLYPFVDLEEVETTIKELMECEDPEPMVAELPLEPGRKEKRYIHLFSDVPATNVAAETIAMPQVNPSQIREKVETLEQVVEELRDAQKLMTEEIQSLKNDLELFRQQFE